MRRVRLFEESGNISYLEGNGNYTIVHFTNAPRLLVAKTLSLCMAELPHFARIHKRHAVNPIHILDTRTNGIKTADVLVGTAWLAVSRRRLQSVVKLLRLQPMEDIEQ